MGRAATYKLSSPLEEAVLFCIPAVLCRNHMKDTAVTAEEGTNDQLAKIPCHSQKPAENQTMLIKD